MGIQSVKKLIKIDNSCAVLALHHVSGVDEETVLRVCKFHDFSPEGGMADEDWIDAAKDLGIKVRMCFSGSQRLKTFLKDHKTGLFLVRTHDHIFALDNGIIVDPGYKETGHFPGLGRLVKWAWRVTKSDSIS